MTNQDIIRESVASLLHIEATPKAAIAALTEHDQTHPLVIAAMGELKALPWNAKAKAKLVLDDMLEKLDAEDAPQAIARIPEIEATIRNLMGTASTALLSIGQLLNEAREEFDTGNDFLAWAREQFEFKKAYVYRLMKVAEEFTPEDVLAGQSINVLHKLAGMPEEVKQQAREAVQDGEALTGKAVEGMAKSAEPEPESDAEAGPDESTTVDTEALHGADFGEDEGAPWHAGTGREAPTGEAPKAVEPEESPEVKHLRELVSELQAELAAARQERESKSSGKSKAPMLPQFNSECYYARLGLSAEQGNDSAEVRKAFRALVKAGYTSQHEAYQALVDAKDSLMQVAEAA